MPAWKSCQPRKGAWPPSKSVKIGELPPCTKETRLAPEGTVFALMHPQTYTLHAKQEG